jgi:hypothetical protein
MDDMLERLIERLNNPTPEQKVQDAIWIRKNMNRAGRMSEELFEKVLTFIIKNDSMDEEHLRYYPDEDVTAEEFMEVFKYIDMLFPKKTDTTDHFPTEEVAFEYKTATFIWCLMIGQGSSCSIRIDKHNDVEKCCIVKYGIANIDKALGYYINPLRVNDEGERI